MKHDNVNYLVVGSFVLLMLAVLMVMLMMITGRTGDTVPYHSYYGNVAKLKYGTQVSFEGYTIGQIEKITPIRREEGTQYRVDFSLREGWRIPVDSRARIVSSGLLSAMSIDIEEGTRNTYLKPGDEIPGVDGVDLFASIAGAASDISSLTSTGIKPLIDNVSRSLQNVASEAEKAVPEILAQLKQLATKLNQTATQVQGLFDVANRKRVSHLLASLDSSLAKLDRLLDQSTGLVEENRADLTQSIADLRASLQVVSQHISAIAFNMEGTSRNLNEFSRQIRENPALLLGSTPPRDKTTRETKSP